MGWTPSTWKQQPHFFQMVTLSSTPPTLLLRSKAYPNSTMKSDRYFCLYRWMPPTAPRGHLPRVALVIARLIVEGEDRGVRPFVVAINDGKEMCKGVSSKYVRPST